MTLAASPDLSPAAYVAEHQRTFARFVYVIKLMLVLHAAGLTFLILWLCTPASFLSASAAGLVILAAGGGFLLRPPVESASASGQG